MSPGFTREAGSLGPGTLRRDKLVPWFAVCGASELWEAVCGAKGGVLTYARLVAAGSVLLAARPVPRTAPLDRLEPRTMCNTTRFLALLTLLATLLVASCSAPGDAPTEVEIYDEVDVQARVVSLNMATREVELEAADGKQVGDHAVAQALGAVAEQGTVHLAHVIPLVAPTEVEARQNREQAWHALSRITSNEDFNRSGRLERHVLEGAPADQLLAPADRIGADLIVLGARSHSVVTWALLGSVAQAVSERAKVPVLLVPVTAV